MKKKRTEKTKKNDCGKCLGLPHTGYGPALTETKKTCLNFFRNQTRDNINTEIYKSICVKCKNARLLNCPVTCCF